MQVRLRLHALEHGRTENSEGLSKLRDRVRSRVDRSARCAAHEVHLTYEDRRIPRARMVPGNRGASFVRIVDHRDARLFVFERMPPLVVPARTFESVEIMTAILKTLPTRFARGQLEKFFGAGDQGNEHFCAYYFTLGRGRPQRPEPVTQLYFTHSGIVLGFFAIKEIVQNKGQLPLLTTLDGDPSEWQIKPDRWVAVCHAPFHRLKERLYHTGFQGWRYFDLKSYRASLESKVRL